MSRAPTMATLVMWFEAGIGEDWSKLRLCGLKIDNDEIMYSAWGTSFLLWKELQTSYPYARNGSLNIRDPRATVAPYLGITLCRTACLLSVLSLRRFQGMRVVMRS